MARDKGKVKWVHPSFQVWRVGRKQVWEGLCRSKPIWGLCSFVRGWALELATTGITANVVAPGPTETELFRQNNPLGSDGERRYLSLIPMNRLGKPEEVAAAIAFLLSEDASFISGQTLFVDGGASIGRAGL